MADAKRVQCPQRPGETFTVREAAKLTGILPSSLRNVISRGQRGKGVGVVNGFAWRYVAAPTPTPAPADGIPPLNAAGPELRDDKPLAMEADFDGDLVLRHLPLLRSVANKIAEKMPRGVDVEDLHQAGVFGLVRAAARFEPSRGNRFSSFAVPWIRGSILDYLRSQDWRPRLARRLDEPAPAFQSMDAPTEPDGGCLRNLIPDVRSPSVPISAEQRERLDELLGPLGSRSRSVLVMHDVYEMTMNEIGFCLGLSQSAVSLIYLTALQVVRAWNRRRMPGVPEPAEAETMPAA